MATIIDPPAGWKYGFPKPIPEDRKKDVTVWLVEQGYPKEMIDSFGEHFYCRYWEQSEEDNKLDLKQLEDKLDEALAKETTESLTEWVDSKRKDDVEKIEEEYYKELEQRREAAKNFTGQVAGRHSDMFTYREMDWMVRGFMDGYSKAKETMYTEEQVREAIDMATTSKYNYKLEFYSLDEIIQSLKK